MLEANDQSGASNMPTAFIPAIRGAQNTAIADALRSDGWTVDGSSRSDAGDRNARAAGADLLVLTVPQDHRPNAMTSFVGEWVEAARKGDVGRIVFNLGGTPGPAHAHPFFAELHDMHDRVASGGRPFVILQPTVYLDNLATAWAMEAVLKGTLAYPVGVDAEVSWLSHRTLGSWVAAVADGKADGRTIPIGGPEALTGAALAREIGAGIGREVAYVPVSPADAAEGMNATMGAPAGDRLAAIYAWLDDQPDFMRVDPDEGLRLGVTLETAREFAERVLARGRPTERPEMVSA